MESLNTGQAFLLLCLFGADPIDTARELSTNLAPVAQVSTSANR